MTRRRYGLAEKILGELDTALRTIAAQPRAGRPAPAAPAEQLAPGDASESARLMRVNHAGEIAAQALYRGQAFVTRDEGLRRELLEAADEEHDHLAWCADRVAQLGSHTSYLAPLWYSGSFAIGTIAGLAGDRHSRGFLAETERQVAAHLDRHLDRLPRRDRQSNAILKQMKRDEIRHGRKAAASGASRLPGPVRGAMRLASALMTGTARWL